MRRAIFICWAMIALAGYSLPEPNSVRPRRRQFMATAYSIEGITRMGTDTEYGIVAADRSVLPLGTRIRVTGAGPYSGRFVVEDTGAKVDGKHIDIYLPDDSEAKEFGIRLVGVEVEEWGDDEMLARPPTRR